eukprot:1878264-Amphidinium_carterae.1
MSLVNKSAFSRTSAHRRSEEGADCHSTSHRLTPNYRTWDAYSLDNVRLRLCRNTTYAHRTERPAQRRAVNTKRTAK